VMPPITTLSTLFPYTTLFRSEFWAPSLLKLRQAACRARSSMSKIGFPAEGIVETAKARGGDLIIMASHGRRGLSKLLLGSETTKDRKSTRLNSSHLVISYAVF